MQISHICTSVKIETSDRSPRGSEHDQRASGHSRQGHKVQRVWDFGFSDLGGVLHLILDAVSWISDGLRGLADGGDILVDIRTQATSCNIQALNID